MTVDYNVPLNRFCSFCTGGRAAKLVQAYTCCELCEAASRGALILGRGSNVLIGDCGFGGEVAVNRTEKIEFGGDFCRCESGVAINALARRYIAEGRSGLEWAYGLPGSVGGAIAGNAGAFGGCAANSVKYVTVLRGGKIKTLNRGECGFCYRGSLIDGVVLHAVLYAPKADGGEVKRKSEQNLLRRKNSQPRGASAGCVFKAAGPVAAGYILDRCGLKGKSAGGAQISEKHANFIINRGGATSNDVLQLIRCAEAAVYDRYGIILRREIKLIGDFF